MRSLALAAALALIPALACGQTIAGEEWVLLAIDGKLTDAESHATLTLEADGKISGNAPCNRYSARNEGTLPELKISAIGATKMACDRLADEQAFFDSLTAMTGIELDGPKNLILTGPDGRSMEFTLASVSSLPECKTCPPAE